MENKKGLGRGLGSLLGMFDDDEPVEVKKRCKRQNWRN